MCHYIVYQSCTSRAPQKLYVGVVFSGYAYLHHRLPCDLEHVHSGELSPRTAVISCITHTFSSCRWVWLLAGVVVALIIVFNVICILAHCLLVLLPCLACHICHLMYVTHTFLM